MTKKTGCGVSNLAVASVLAKRWREEARVVVPLWVRTQAGDFFLRALYSLFQGVFLGCLSVAGMFAAGQATGVGVHGLPVALGLAMGAAAGAVMFFSFVSNPRGSGSFMGWFYYSDNLGLAGLCVFAGGLWNRFLKDAVSGGFFTLALAGLVSLSASFALNAAGMPATNGMAVLPVPLAAVCVIAGVFAGVWLVAMMDGRWNSNGNGALAVFATGPQARWTPGGTPCQNGPVFAATANASAGARSSSGPNGVAAKGKKRVWSGWGRGLGWFDIALAATGAALFFISCMGAGDAAPFQAAVFFLTFLLGAWAVRGFSFLAKGGLRRGLSLLLWFVVVCHAEISLAEALSAGQSDGFAPLLSDLGLEWVLASAKGFGFDGFWKALWFGAVVFFLAGAGLGFAAVLFDLSEDFALFWADAKNPSEGSERAAVEREELGIGVGAARPARPGGGAGSL